MPIPTHAFFCPAVECGVTFKEAVEQNRPPQMSDVFEDPARWGQLATTAFKVGGRRPCCFKLKSYLRSQSRWFWALMGAASHHPLQGR